MLGINDLAPEFTLKNTSKEDVSLSDFTDKTVVLAFYPGAFTGVCDAEMCAFQDNLKSFNDLNAIVLGISVDSPWANGGFSKQYSLEFDLLSDLDKKGLIYKKDGATWFAGSKANRPVDRVLIKSSGEPTYRLPDMAYHRTKFERNYDKIIDVFGADHMDAYPDV